MRKYKVCVYAICKNEEKFVSDWVDSMSEADEIIVTDTGSTDKTKEKLTELGVKVYCEKIQPFRFDTARNLSLSHVPLDADICVCTDLDERFEKGWREKLETAWRKHIPKNSGEIAKTGRYIYNWSRKEDGSEDVQFYYFKVHERNNFTWVCPVHEHVQYMGRLPLELVYIDGMVLNHYPDNTKSRGSYLPLLELAVAEDSTNERMWFYLGREYIFKGRWEQAAATLIHYLALPTATWKDERSAAMRYIAAAKEKLGEDSTALKYRYLSIAECPYIREPYIEFAQACYEKKDWVMVYFLVHEALKIKEKSKTYINTGSAWDHTPYDLLAISAYNMELFTKSYEYAQKAHELSPNNKRLQNNLSVIKNKLSGTLL